MYLNHFSIFSPLNFHFLLLVKHQGVKTEDQDFSCCFHSASDKTKWRSQGFEVLCSITSCCSPTARHSHESSTRKLSGSASTLLRFINALHTFCIFFNNAGLGNIFSRAMQWGMHARGGEGSVLYVVTRAQTRTPYTNTVCPFFMYIMNIVLFLVTDGIESIICC